MYTIKKGKVVKHKPKAKKLFTTQEEAEAYLQNSVVYNVGDFFYHEKYGVYILAMVSYNRVNLISLYSGNRYSNGINLDPSNPPQVTVRMFDEMIGVMTPSVEFIKISADEVCEYLKKYRDKLKEITDEN